MTDAVRHEASPAAVSFRYESYRIHESDDRVECVYVLGDREFREEFTFPEGGDWSSSAVHQAVRILFLLAGISYYKTAAPRVLDLGVTPVSDLERVFLRQYYVEGLGEFAYRNGLDLSDLEVVGGTNHTPKQTSTDDLTSARRALIPFGGGLDSIVSVELLRDLVPDSALFVANRPGDRFAAIEEPARVTGLPVVRAERLIDPQVLRSTENHFLNGHVPVTAIISALACVTAALQGRDAVVMSNEWSSSSATLVTDDGRHINHQYSKSDLFENTFRQVLAQHAAMPDYFSLLRPFSELWIAQYFAEHCQDYLGSFRSCNRAFHIDQAIRADRWCGQCDKCAFIDLILSPFVPATALRTVFDGNEPLDNPTLPDTFRRLLGLVPDAKPWECVGDVAESRVAARLARSRSDRSSTLLDDLVRESESHTDPDVSVLLRPLSKHNIPDRYAPATVVV
jgi:hypothetical protein